MIHGHGGNIFDIAKRLNCQPSDIVDMSSNVNPMGPPPGLMNFLQERLDSVTTLPEVDADAAVQAFARRYGVNPEQVLAGNGTTQFIYMIPKVLRARHALIVGPTYSDYADACALNGVAHEFAFAEESRDFEPDRELLTRRIAHADVVFICNPNNPTGTLIPAVTLYELCQAYPYVMFVVDESYLPFVADSHRQSLIRRRLPNMMILNSMSKIFRIPGLRIGFLIAPESLILRFRPCVLPWSVNSLAQAAVRYLMERPDATESFIQTSQQYLQRQRERLIQRFANHPDIRLFPSETSFILAKLRRRKSDEICQLLLKDRILIRNCANFAGLSDQFIRISLKTEAINDMAAEKIQNAI